MQTSQPRVRCAIVGTGLSGATLARALADAGCAVQLFDKSRGAGGRLATRRAGWTDPTGAAQTTALDHGAPGFAARTPDFSTFIDAAVRAGQLKAWLPRTAPTGRPLAAAGSLFVVQPDMPRLCRTLLDGLPARYGFTVQALQRRPEGWFVIGEDAAQAASAATERRNDPPAGPFDAVLLALPAPQAAPLLAPHQAAWSGQAAELPMVPIWTLMGVAAPTTAGPAWDLCQPAQGPLAWLARNDTKPGRAAADGQVHWVAHARVDWTKAQLERPAAEVQAELQQAIAEVLGEAPRWAFAIAHRWRFALPPAAAAAVPAACWWDGSLGLGVCGDYFAADVDPSKGEPAPGHSEGVERAWASAQALSSALSSTLSSALSSTVPVAVTTAAGAMLAARR